jgi:hypothetical protein
MLWSNWRFVEWTTDFGTTRNYCQLSELPYKIIAFFERRTRLWTQDSGYSFNMMGRLNISVVKLRNGSAGSISWPPRSPDLTRLGRLLLGSVTAMVYKTKPLMRVEILRRIMNAAYIENTMKFFNGQYTPLQTEQRHALKIMAEILNS